MENVKQIKWTDKRGRAQVSIVADVEISDAFLAQRGVERTQIQSITTVVPVLTKVNRRDKWVLPVVEHVSMSGAEDVGLPQTAIGYVPPVVADTDFYDLIKA